MADLAPLTPPLTRGDGWRDELRATLRLSWPLATANLLQMLTYAIDVIFIARLGEDQLAVLVFVGLLAAVAARAAAARYGVVADIIRFEF